MASPTRNLSEKKPVNKLFKVIILLTVASVAAPLLVGGLLDGLADLVKGLLVALLTDWNDILKHPKIFSAADSYFMNDMAKKQPPPEPPTTTTTKATTTTTTTQSTTTTNAAPDTTTTTTTTTTTPAPQTPTYPPNVRLDFRLMSKEQWRQFVEAVQYIMNNNAPNHAESIYNTFVGYHRSSEAPCAHDGPGFLTWHSVYGHAFDSALREYNPSVTVPIFDTRPDTEIPNHCDACQYTEDLLGNNNGVVNIGPFKNRQVYPSDCAASTNGPLLKRACNPDYKALLIDYAEYDTFVNDYKVYRDFCKPFNKAFEDSHNYIHVTMGGHLNDLTCSSNDIMFFFIHHFVHSIYDISMDKYSAEAQQQLSYPTDSDFPANHRSTDPAKPFTVSLGDAFKQSIARQMSFITVPRNCDNDDQCNPTNSDRNAFWCKSQTRRCATKIRIGGKCQDNTMTYPDKACFRQSFCKADPTCTGGVCTCPR